MKELLEINYLTINGIENSPRQLQCICTINAQHLYLIKRGASILDSKKLIYTVDSQWIKKIFEKYSNRKIAVTTGVDVTDYILQKVKKQRENVFFLGASSESNLKARKRFYLETGQVAYGDTPNKNALFDDIYVNALIAEFKRTNIRYVVLGFGAPYQEEFMLRYYERFISETDVKIMVGAGAVIDFYSGVQQKCPTFINKIGLEIFYRLLMDISLKRANRIKESLQGLLWLRRIAIKHEK